MMKFLLRALLALTMLTSTANAGIFVSGDSGDDTEGDGSYALPYATIGKANNNCGPGDTVYVEASATAYTHFPNPWTNGTALAPIVFIGDTVAYNKVKVPGGTSDKAYVHRLGFRYTSGIGGDYRADYNVWAKSKVYAGASGITGPNGVLYRSVIFGASTADVDSAPGTGTSFSVKPNSINEPADDLCIQDCTFNLRAVSNTSVTILFQLQPDGSVPGLRLNRFRFYRNTIQLEQPNGQAPTNDIKLTMWNRLKNYEIVQNNIELRDSSGYSGGSAYQGLLVRDYLDGGLWFNNTIVAKTERAGTGPITIDLTSAGNTQSGNGTGNIYRWNTFKNYTPMEGGVMYQWKMQDNDSLCYNAVICSTNVANGGFEIRGNTGNTNIWRNNFINLGTGGAFRLNSGGPWSGTMTIRNNNFYTRSTSTAANMMAANYVPGAGGTSVIRSDYNNFAHYGSGAQMNYLGTRTGIGSGSLPCNQRGWDCNSISKTPAFTDSVGDNWNLIPIGSLDLAAGTTSFVQGAGWQGATIGQYDTLTATADATAPTAIADLAATALGTSTILLQWTSTGDDAGNGTATAYDLRMSTATITGGNFADASRFVGPPAPVAAGTIQRYTVTGLAPGTTYYFAIKAIDEAGNTSTISNVASATAGGPTSPVQSGD